MYTYKAIVTKVYDGDTITCDIDLGMYVWLRNQKIRLSGIDAPEVVGTTRAAGLKSRDFLHELIFQKEIILETIQDKTEKYGRWLGLIHLPLGPAIDALNVNSFMLANGLAVPLEYP